MAAPAVQDAVTNMLPLQLGVAVEGACETTTIAMQHWVNEHRTESNWSVLQVDLTNAFNSIDRRSMLVEVAARAPKLSAWAQYCYRSHSHLFLQNGHPLSSQQGVQQGDPLGPLFFSLAWQKVVETLPTDLRLHLWYLDDGHLVGTPECLQRCLEHITAQGASMGVKLNPGKCRLWGPGSAPLEGEDMDLDSLWNTIPRVPWSADSGLKVLGLPVCYPGTSKFAETTFSEVLRDLQEACEVLQNLGDPQTEHLLLRYCMDACRIMHYLRGIDCTPLTGLIQHAAGIIKQTWAVVLGCPAITETDWTQSSLPHRLAGLGIKDPMVILPAARLAAGLTYKQRAEALALPPEVCKYPADWNQQVRTMQGILGANFGPLEEWAAGSVPPSSLAEDHLSQIWWSHIIHAVRAVRLERVLTLRDRVRYSLHACLAQPHGCP